MALLQGKLAALLRPKKLAGNVWKLVKLMLDNIVIQKFIERRSRSRWLAHMCLAWGCLIAFAITFPLSWGWVQFGSHGNRYVVEFMGAKQFTFEPHSVVGFLFFNGLNFSAVFVLVGVAWPCTAGCTKEGPKRCRLWQTI